MINIIYPLKNNWKVDEDSSIHPSEQIKNRVNSEDWYTHCKGWPLVKQKDIKGKLGKPLEE